MEKINNYIDKHKSLIVFLLYTPFLCSFNLPNGENIPDLKFIFELLRLTSALITFCMFVFIKKKTPSKLFWALFAMQVWQVATTCITNKKVVVSIYDFAAAIAIPMIVEMFLDDPKKLISGLMLSYELAVYVNFPSFFLYEGEMFEYERDFLLGSYGILIQFMIPAIAVGTINYKINEQKFRSLVLIITSVISIILCNSGTNKAIMMAFVGLFLYGYIFKKIIKKKENISLTFLFMCTFAISFFFVFVYFNIISDNNIVVLFIKNVLKKPTYLTGRDQIWNEALRLIKQSPIIGKGFRTTLQLDGWGAGHAHNAFVDKALTGGIPMLILYIIFHLRMSIKVDKIQPSIVKLILTILCFGVFLTYTTESYIYFYRFYILFFLIYHLDTILCIKKEEID